jgi:hypothetical protein
MRAQKSGVLIVVEGATILERYNWNFGAGTLLMGIVCQQHH